MENFDNLDRQIAIMYGLGFHQEEIAKKFNISQATVSLRLTKINNAAKSSDNIEHFFWNFLIDPLFTKEMIKRLVEARPVV